MIVTLLPAEGEVFEFGDSPRFAPTRRHVCPRCGGPVLQDNWPPNTSGGNMDTVGIQAHGSVKYVCQACRIAFRVKWTHRFEQGQAQDGFAVTGITTLVERDGYLLTPHDVKRFKYFDSHGVWPTEVYRW